MKCNNNCNPCRCSAEGERQKQDAFAVLTANHEALIRRAQRALLTMLLETGSATADDVRELVDLPPGVNAKCFGAAPGPLARSKIIRADGFTKTCRPIGHARPITVWALENRDKALWWLAAHPDLPNEVEAGQVAAVQRQGVLFGEENATPTVPAAGAAG